jgi:hypothetical protein
MPDRGKLVVLSFFLLAVALAGGAMWYHFAKTRWAMEFWGKEAARLIVRAPEVELWRLAPIPSVEDASAETADNAAEPARQTLKIEEKSFFITGRRPLVAAPGLIHMRMALVEDTNFDTRAMQPEDRTWDYAFRFYSPEQELIVAIDSQHGYLRTIGEPGSSIQPHATAPVATITPIASGLKQFLEEQFKEPPEEAEAGPPTPNRKESKTH